MKQHSVSVLYLLSDKIYKSGIYQTYRNCYLHVKTTAVWLVWLQGHQHHACIAWTALYLLWVWIPWMQFSGMFGCKSITFRRCEVCSGIICKSLWKQFLPPTAKVVISPHMPFFYWSGAPVPVNTSFYWPLRCKGLKDCRAGQFWVKSWKKNERVVKHWSLTASRQVHGQGCHGNYS